MKKKIAYISTFYPYRGGIAQFNALLYNELIKEYKVNAYTFKRQYPDFLFPGQTQLVQPGDNAQAVDSIRLLDTINPFTYISSASKIKDFAPDIIINKFWMPFFAPSLGYISKSLSNIGTKSISILDNVIPHEKRFGDIQLIKYFLNRTDAFIVMSKAVESDLLSLKPNAKYKFLEHPLYNHFGEKINKLSAREKLNIPKNQKVLLFFGFIRDYKGLDLLIDALKYLPEDYVILIAGESYGSFDKYTEQLQKNKLSDRVHQFVRYISDDEVPLFFSASDLLVLPYKTATQSGIIGITYHFELPVVATKSGGLPEMILPHKTGLIVDRIDSVNIANKILDYFNNNLEAEFISNIKSYKTVCTWENFAAGVSELIDELN